MIVTPWLDKARRLIGTKETHAAINNPIVQWADSLGGWIEEYYTKDTIPWCGLFVAYVMFQCGYKPYQKGLSAREWLNWGKECDPQIGAIHVYERTGGAHVGFASKDRDEGFDIVGGNQKDQVCELYYPDDKLIGSVWPLPLRTR
jgi:uncharacterized protein (TIGR02594 family)